MGLLDDAIREHLDLKRQHGADEDELARQEAEALGPVTDEDLSTPEETPGAAGSDGEREPGWPFDRVAENELAGEPDEPSFQWKGEEEAAEVEVPDFVPAEPPTDTELEQEPEPVDMPTQAFSAVDSLEAETGDEEGAGFRSDLEESPPPDDLRAGEADHETRLLGPDDEAREEPLEPESLEAEALEPEPLDPEPPPAAGLGPIEEEPADEESPPLDLPPEHPVSVHDEPLGPVPDEPDPVEDELFEPLPAETDEPLSEPPPLPAETDEPLSEPPPPAAETDEPLSEPEPLEPYPLGSVAPAVEPQPSAESGEPPAELGSPFEPSLGDEPLSAPADPLRPEPPDGDPPAGPDPAAEQGSPPGEPPPLEEDDLGPVTQAWSIESEPGFGVPSADEAPSFRSPEPEGLGPPDLAPIEERPVFEPFPDAEGGPDDPLELPSDAPLELGPNDADPDPPPVALDDAPAEPPAGARGFFDEAEEDDTLWQEERPAFDPDFEN